MHRGPGIGPVRPPENSPRALISTDRDRIDLILELDLLQGREGVVWWYGSHTSPTSLDGRDAFEDLLRDLRDDGISEGSNSVHPSG